MNIVLTRVQLGISFFIVTSSFLLSCAHTEKIGNISESIPRYDREFDFSSPERVLNQLQRIGNLKRQGNQATLVKILVAFNSLGLSDSNKTTGLLPRSKSTITVSSFCASAGKAIPDGNEVFQWVKDKVNITLANQVLNLYSKNPGIGASKIQELIWNLENHTYYEDYPESSKELLKQASPQAPFILPSRTKSELINDLLPERVKDVGDLIQGKYYSFKQFRELLASNQLSVPKAGNGAVAELPATPVFATTKSRGFESQIITFYNPVNERIDLSIQDYYLKPIRADVQPILLASVFPRNEEIKKILEQYSLKMLGYLGSQYPTLTADEKNLVKQMPIDAAIVFYNAMLAEQMAEKYFPNSELNGKADAFRHYVWAALLTRDLGEETARKFLDAHEANPGQTSAEKGMDNFNNEKGIEAVERAFANHSFSDEELFTQAVKEVNAGSIKTLSDENK